MNARAQEATQTAAPRHLARLSYPEVADYLKDADTVLVPCGATEQHGSHLPVGVDAMTAIAVADDVSSRTGVLVTPPMWFGWSPHHMGFAGTVSLRPETLTALAEDVATSLLHHGFRRVIFINGHRLANLPPLSIASTRVRNRTGAWGDHFFYYAPDGQVPQREQPYATIVTKDYPDDDRSHLNQPGRWRLNISVGREMFRELTGEDPRQGGAEWDHAVSDVLLPHPVYRAQGWVAIVTPGVATIELATDLLRWAHDAARRRAARRAKC